MNMRICNPPLRTALVIASAFVLVSCQPPASSTQSTQDNGIQDIRVQVVEPTRTTTKVEQFPLPNCGGTDRLAQSLGTYASANKSATVGGKATVTGGGEVGIPETTKLKLEIQVELAYQQTFESTNSRLDSIEMSAAAGTHVVYAIIWEEQTFNSIVQYSADGKVYEVPYTYKLSVPKIDKSYNVACSGNGAGNNDSPTSAPFTSATATPPSIQQTSQQVDYQQTGGGARVTYTLSLGEGEVLVGHADKFQGVSGCVAFLIIGPGNFEFWIESGIWYKWINTTPELNETLLQQQKDILVNTYNCVPVQVKRLP